ncbi:MAG: phosphomethylpyrimidine synthase, partial [Verrucomicrobia bacterium]|nr:phosphomethylpyrimidine synthase [Verrucomicrobiota bacterium]
MIANKDALEPQSRGQLPNSTKVYVAGARYPDLRVPMREIRLSDTRTLNGQLEANAPVRVYDTSGPWGDPAFHGRVEQGLPALRRDWILRRGDVEQYEGRRVTPHDDGYLSQAHRDQTASRTGTPSSILHPPSSHRRPLRAIPGKVVTQLAYARAGVITPEMEF